MASADERFPVDTPTTTAAGELKAGVPDSFAFTAFATLPASSCAVPGRAPNAAGVRSDP